jgi:UDP-N-acetylmuramoyl-tripeptide--D-alanyl-D-alanine ligase
MNLLTYEQIATWADGALLATQRPDGRVVSVNTDTRVEMKGGLFVPLVGERFDGHDFIPQALAQGATAVFTAKPELARDGAAFIHVSDTLAALQSLAARYRASLQAFLSLGVTGSNGKTSTKDFLTSVFGQQLSVLATRGNLNNHIGLPLTVMATNDRHRVGIYEMGMNHGGEIMPLAAIARPDIAVITNVGTAHIEFLGSRQAIATEKGTLAWAVGEAGHIILQAEDDFTPFIAARCRGRVWRAGLTTGDVRAESIAGSSFDLVTPDDRVRITLPVPGRHMIQNALLAATAGVSQGISIDRIARGLSQVRLHGGRLERKSVAGLTILDDSYNANPDSMLAALATLAAEPVSGRRIAVLGRMGELGTHSAEGHRRVGEAARAQGIDELITVGTDDSRLIHEAFGSPGALHMATHAEAADHLRAHATAQDLILVKGSRSAAMEKVLHALNPNAASSAAH